MVLPRKQIHVDFHASLLSQYSVLDTSISVPFFLSDFILKYRSVLVVARCPRVLKSLGQGRIWRIRHYSSWSLLPGRQSPGALFSVFHPAAVFFLAERDLEPVNFQLLRGRPQCFSMNASRLIGNDRGKLIFHQTVSWRKSCDTLRRARISSRWATWTRESLIVYPSALIFASPTRRLPFPTRFHSR